jgi:hypothetical protein
VVGLGPVAKGQQYLLAQADDVAGPERCRAGETHVVDPDAVGAAHVFQYKHLPLPNEAGMVAGNHGILYDNVIVGMAADGHGGISQGKGAANAGAFANGKVPSGGVLWHGCTPVYYNGRSRMTRRFTSNCTDNYKI